MPSMTDTPPKPADPAVLPIAPAADATPAAVSGASQAGVQPAAQPAARKPLPPEIGGPTGPEPTRYGDWERKGRVSDF
jgi:hypothetical protein